METEKYLQDWAWMEICQEKVCCVSLKTKQVVAGQDQGIKVVKIKVVKMKVVGMTKEPNSENGDWRWWFGTFELLEGRAEQQKPLKTSHFSRRETWLRFLWCFFKNCLTLIFLVYFWMRLQNPNQLTWEGFPEPASADLLALPWPLPPCKSTSSLVIIVIVAILTHNISQTHTFRHLGREQDTWKPISAAANPLLTEANIAFTSFYFHNSSSHIFTGPTGPLVADWHNICTTEPWWAAQNFVHSFESLPLSSFNQRVLSEVLHLPSLLVDSKINLLHLTQWDPHPTSPALPRSVQFFMSSLGVTLIFMLYP